MLKQMKVGTRLFSAFSAVAVLGALVAGVGVYNMGRLSDMTAQMYGTELLGLSYIKEANVALVEIGRARGNLLLADSADERNRQKGSMDASLTSSKSNLDKARPLFVTARAKELFGTYAELSTRYEAGLKRVVDLVGSVQGMRGVMNDITLASAEQSAGIEQVNQAITQMDQVTQQNAALVEQAAAAAASMQEQAAALSAVVGVFRLDAGQPAPRLQYSVAA